MHVRELQNETGACSPPWRGLRAWRAGVNCRTRIGRIGCSHLFGIALTRAALDWGESALAELAFIEAAAAENPQPADTSTNPEPGL